MKTCNYCDKPLHGATVTITGGTMGGRKMHPKFYHLECYGDMTGCEYHIEYTNDDEYENFEDE